MAGPKDELVEICRSYGGDRLRDVWIFTADAEESVYLRDDLEAKLDGVDVDQFIDAERYGYIERDTYEALYYAEYEYTLRGMDEFDQYRTFLGDRSNRIGLMLSFDTNGEIDYRALTDDLRTLYERYGPDELSP